MVLSTSTKKADLSTVVRRTTLVLLFLKLVRLLRNKGFCLKFSQESAIIATSDTVLDAVSKWQIIRVLSVPFQAPVVSSTSVPFLSLACSKKIVWQIDFTMLSVAHVLPNGR